MNFSVSPQRRNRTSATWSVTPMIDVVFLLLVFFIVSTTQEPPESRLTPALQAESGAASNQTLDPQVLEVIEHQGFPAFRIGQRIIRDKQALTEVLAQLPKQPGIFVKPSSTLRARWAAAAIQACRDAGFSRITYVPDPS